MTITQVRYTTPVEPRLRLLLIAIRRALLLMAGAIEEYLNGTS